MDFGSLFLLDLSTKIVSGRPAILEKYVLKQMAVFQGFQDPTLLVGEG